MVFKSRNQSPAASGRSVRRYHVTGMDGRCELLFHSMMRLLDDRALSRWVHDAHQHDLVVTGPAVADLPCPNAVRRPIASFTSGRNDDCAMLRLAGMVEVLDAVDRALTSASTPAEAARHRAGDVPDSAMRLTRWPDASLVAWHRSGPKMATLLLSRPMTLSELSRFSGVEPTVCAQFVDRLSASGLIARGGSAPRGEQPGTRSRGGGLFAAIRARLGMGEVFG